MLTAILAGLYIAAAISIPMLFGVFLATAIIDDIEETERKEAYIAEHMRNMR